MKARGSGGGTNRRPSMGIGNLTCCDDNEDFLITEGFIVTDVHVDTVLGRIALHGKARSVQ